MAEEQQRPTNGVFQIVLIIVGVISVIGSSLGGAWVITSGTVSNAVGPMKLQVDSNERSVSLLNESFSILKSISVTIIELRADLNKNDSIMHDIGLSMQDGIKLISDNDGLLKAMEVRVSNTNETMIRDRLELAKDLIQIEQREIRSLDSLNIFIGSVDDKLQKEILALLKVIADLDIKLQQEQRLRVETLKTATTSIDSLSRGRHDQIIIRLEGLKESIDVRFANVGIISEISSLAEKVKILEKTYIPSSSRGSQQ